ncbi:hypothetical protein J7M23_08310 [Candidatus Sumerlaeota bacterium]|nr:hypothetical protein [Candidatus Sumerlaeota bacterium]
MSTHSGLSEAGMPEEATQIKVIPLICRNCGSALSGAEEDILFFCPRCRVGWEISGSSFKERKVFYAKPRKKDQRFEKLIYLPFWVFEISNIEIKAKPERIREFFMRKSSGVNRIYVEAYECFMGDIYGNLALRYLHSAPRYELVEARKVVGCTRSAETVLPFLKYYLLRYLDQFQDITGVEVSLDSNEFYLVCFPYAFVGENQLLDLTLDFTILTQGILNFHSFRQEFGL